MQIVPGLPSYGVVRYRGERVASKARMHVYKSRPAGIADAGMQRRGHTAQALTILSLRVPIVKYVHSAQAKVGELRQTERLDFGETETLLFPQH